MARQFPDRDSPPGQLALARVRAKAAELLEKAAALLPADLAQASELIADLVIRHRLEPQEVVAWFCQSHCLNWAEQPLPTTWRWENPKPFGDISTISPLEQPARDAMVVVRMRTP